MSHPKQAVKRKRRNKAAPLLGVAGLSLSLASGASAAVGGSADLPKSNVETTHVTICEEELSDVSLATFYVTDRERPAATSHARLRFAQMGGCGGGCGCGGCGCWTGTYYTNSVFGDGSPPPPVRPPHAKAVKKHP